MALVDLRRDAEADCVDTLVQELANSDLEAAEQGLFRLDRRRVLAVGDHRPVAADKAGEDLGPADVDSDHQGIHALTITARGPGLSACRRSAATITTFRPK